MPKKQGAAVKRAFGVARGRRITFGGRSCHDGMEILYFMRFICHDVVFCIEQLWQRSVMVVIRHDMMFVVSKSPVTRI